MEVTYLPIKIWMDKEDVVCVCVCVCDGKLLSHKTEWIWVSSSEL